ncbi:hypothetical protein [Thauera aromatica]|uniref:hypothetical protein n=1 Tax=Thauera aromatica TaxID=59405 RepID=UPI001FFCCF19|nr:hypothetical protein [Thauera aromatica]MCK2097405.1 hypothetical protein [Thauera aromatica]
MITFVLGALLIAAAAIGLFLAGRSRVARLPYPAIIWLGVILGAILLTLWLAKETLS